MKDINKLTAYIGKFTEKVVENVERVQKETAQTIWEDVVNQAPMKTGEYISSIKVSPTTLEGNTIKTEVYTDATVSTLSGKTYNLGFLLETGTQPHIIEAQNAGGLFWGVYEDGKPVIRKRVHHPGTVAQPHFKPALDKNRHTYLENIRRAVKEAERQ